MENSIWGQEHDRKMAAFDESIKDVQEKYKDAFIDKVNLITGEQPDDLRNHFITQWDGQTYRIGFIKSSYVSESIQSEVTKCFVRIFSN